MRFFVTAVMTLSALLITAPGVQAQAVPEVKAGFVSSLDEFQGLLSRLRERTPPGKSATLAYCVCEKMRNRIAYAYIMTGGEPQLLTEETAKVAERFGGCVKSPAFEMIGGSSGAGAQQPADRPGTGPTSGPSGSGERGAPIYVGE